MIFSIYKKKMNKQINNLSFRLVLYNYHLILHHIRSLIISQALIQIFKFLMKKILDNYLKIKIFGNKL